MKQQTTTGGRIAPSANGLPPCAPVEREPEWLSAVVADYEGRLVRYAARIAGDIERGRDVAQETFLRLCREPDVARSDHLAQWLFTVCRRVALDVARKESRMSPLADHSTGVCVEASTASAIESSDAHAGVLRQLASLPANQQEVVRLKFQESMSYRQIAAITGLSESNVGYLLHTAIKTLREKLGPIETT
jgi:RNA polymerase sigma-70 factor (ECF subfamily)